ncbi:hypothetical protein [Kitasatospora sp. NPDC050463]|uniref:hypothetical protein n=1 Tax=Kitasatospora sp. NPDC050463 TaxID=3155786 RepID=UPI0034036497
MSITSPFASGDEDVLLVVELLPFVSPFLLLLVALVLTVRLVRARLRGAPATAGALVLAAVGAAFAASCAYVTGSVAGPGSAWITDRKWCRANGWFQAETLDRTTFPMSAHCAPGGDELVPAWVNPVLVTGSLVAAVALAAGLAAHLRARAGRTEYAGRRD